MKARNKRLMSLIMCAMLVTSLDGGVSTVYAEETTATEYIAEETVGDSADIAFESTEVETEEAAETEENTETKENTETEENTETKENTETEEVVYESTGVEVEEETITTEAVAQTEETGKIENLKVSGAAYTLSVQSGEDITDELSTALKAYKNIVIPAGTYTCKKINMSGISGITITATGAVIQAVAAADDAILFTANGQSANGITVIGGTWQGSSKAPIFRFYGKNKNINLKDLTVTGGKDCGIRMKDATGVTLDNVTISSNRKW